MRAAPALRTVIVASLVVSLPIVLLGARSGLQARPAPAGPLGAAVLASGSDEGQEPEPVPKVYLSPPVTAEAAATWIKLQKKIPMAFPNETPLEDILKYIKAATAEGAPAAPGAAQADGKPEPKDGLTIYVDPVALQEAEKTMTSPITIDVDGIPLATSLRLALRQLSLTYHVQQDGLLVIDNEERAEEADIPVLVLNSLAKLRADVAALRNEVAALRNTPLLGSPKSRQ